MIKIKDESCTSDLKYAIIDTTTGKTLLNADNLVALFFILQECIYTVANEKANDIIIEERLEQYQQHC